MAAIGIRFAAAGAWPGGLGGAAASAWPHEGHDKAPAARLVPHFGHIVAMKLLLDVVDQRSLRSTLIVTGAPSLISTVPTLVPFVSCHSISAFLVFVPAMAHPLPTTAFW
jgi:hypothetical protein